MPPIVATRTVGLDKGFFVSLLGSDFLLMIIPC
jgi:hypothetical protein